MENIKAIDKEIVNINIRLHRMLQITKECIKKLDEKSKEKSKD